MQEKKPGLKIVVGKNNRKFFTATLGGGRRRRITSRFVPVVRVLAMGGAGAGGGENNTAAIDALLREFPALGRTEDGRVKCSLTGHVMQSRVEVLLPYVGGKRFTAAVAKERSLGALSEFEPHIVKSRFVPNKLFCRITGRYVAATEKAVLGHCAGKRFERGVESLSEKAEKSGEKHVMLVEQDPRVGVTAVKEKQDAVNQANGESAPKSKPKAPGTQTRDSTTAAAEPPQKSDTAAVSEDAKKRERLRLNGGFDTMLQCWVPPAHVLESDSETETEAEGEDSDDSDDDADDDETETIPVVRAPNFAKAAARLNSKRDAKALGGAGVGAVGKKEKYVAVGVVVGKKEKGGAVVPTGTAKRTPETALKPGKKTAWKPAKRRRA